MSATAQLRLTAGAKHSAQVSQVGGGNLVPGAITTASHDPHCRKLESRMEPDMEPDSLIWDEGIRTAKPNKNNTCPQPPIF